jgi:DNA-binding MltR family transcriptional regulator
VRHKKNPMWNVSPEHFEVIHEIEDGPDRVAAIVTASLIEAGISEIISRRLKRGDSEYEKEQRNHLLGHNAPLGAIASKTRLAFLLGMLTKDAYQDLLCIYKIRNQFAHDPASKTFDSDSVKTKCENLKLIKQDRRAFEASGIATDSKGNVTKFETSGLSISQNGERRVNVSILDYSNKINTSRGKYIITAKLLLAAFYLYKRDDPPTII